MFLSASDQGDFHVGMRTGRSAASLVLLKEWGYETRLRASDLSTFNVFSVGPCFEDLYLRNMPVCVNKILAKILTAGELFSSLPSALILRKQRQKISGEQ